MNTHTLCFCPLIRKLQAFEILKWAQGSQWRKQRTSNFTREIQLIFSLQWKYSFHCSIFSLQWKYSFLYFHDCEIQGFFFKYALYLINIFLYFITLYIIKTCITPKNDLYQLKYIMNRSYSMKSVCPKFISNLRVSWKLELIFWGFTVCNFTCFLLSVKLNKTLILTKLWFLYVFLFNTIRI